MTKINSVLKFVFSYQFISVVFVLVYLVHFSMNTDNFKVTIKSDGEGYYSYLPAIYLLEDNTFKKNKEIKKNHVGYEDDYMIVTEDGRFINKYFGGVSFIASPAFFGITAAQKIASDEAPDGYNRSYFVGMFLYSVLLFVIGFIIYTKAISNYFQLERRKKWIFVVLLVCTTWFFSSMHAVAFANNYLFVCFSLSLLLILKIIEHPHRTILIYVFFFLIGIITITRPTSLIFLLMILYFFDNFSSFFGFVKKHLFRLNVLLIGGILFLIPIIYQFSVWKWQTGEYFVWSYSGEGFNWFSPALFDVFFSYRTGILFHSPVLLFCLVYAIVQFRKNAYKSVIYLLYFFLICYISASWWCYDFETKYGLRNFNEHYVFLLLPLFDFAKNVRNKWSIAILSIITLLSFVRFNQFVFGYNTNQRFTASTYWKSLVAFGESNKNRWSYYRSLPPFGKVEFSESLIQYGFAKVESDVEFYLTSSKSLKLKAGERVYVKVSYDRTFKGKNNKPPLFIIDFSNEATGEHFYQSSLGFVDAKAENETVEIYRHCFDNLQQFNQLKMYFWNIDKVEGELKNVTVEIEKYTSNH